MAVWRVLLPLLCLVAYAHAGGRTLSAQESAQFLQLFSRYCSNPSASPSQDGNTFFYCKTSDQGPRTEQVNHDANVQPGDTPKQVIFVQPPPTNYIHNVALTGSPGNPQETEIYVLPSNAQHDLQLQDTRSAVQAQKPSLFFLSGDQPQNDNRRPPPIGRPGGQQGGNVGQRPSAPPPGPSNPAVIGIGTGLSSGGQGGNLGGYSGLGNNQQLAYGVPARNQRNVASQYRTL